jgi:hypothetical protein
MPRAPSQPSSESPDDLQVPADARRSAGKNHATGCLFVAVLLILPTVLYFGFFAVVVLEEMFVGSGWFRENLPKPAGRFLQTMYTPLFWLMDQVDG